MTQGPFAIALRGLTRHFGETLALDDVTLQVKRGEVLGLIGPNGAGKTTLVRVLAGLLRADGGELSVLGLDPYRQGDLVRQKLGVLTESAGHYRHLTGAQELAFFGRLYGVVDPERLARHWLGNVGLGEAMHQQVGGYSTGMARRLGLARAMIHSPELLLLDEPTSGLDPGGIRHVLALLAENAKERGTTVILCSHVLSQLETVCHRYALLRRGRLVAQGTVDELAQHVKIQAAARLRLRGTVPALALGLAVEPLGQDLYEIELADPQQLPKVVEELARTCEIWHVEMVGRSLDSVYFQLVGATA